LKIREIHAIGLVGGTPDGGWSNELERDICVHTLITVTTDAGLTGWGSVFTSGDLVRASMAVLNPILVGEHALEPERVSEKLHQHTFWQGRGGAITHTISGIDIALWDILGQATGQPVGRLLGGRYRERVQPYASSLSRSPNTSTQWQSKASGRSRSDGGRSGGSAMRWTRRSCGRRGRRLAPMSG
jgi:L-alanine-DL-glutamate epimerase-like enolase superfamily enzyme